MDEGDQMNEETYISDSEVFEWELKRSHLKLWVCSQCGFIANRITEHECESISCSDNWELNAVCMPELIAKELESYYK